jgi:hypothetical protein
VAGFEIAIGHMLDPDDAGKLIRRIERPAGYIPAGLLRQR